MDLFQGSEEYLSPDEGDYDSALQSGLIVFDTNVLLDIYRYNRRVRSELIGALEWAAERLWIPHQVALEFVRNRKAVITEVNDGPQPSGALTATANKIDNDLASWRVRTGATAAEMTSIGADAAIGALHLLIANLKQAEEDRGAGVTLRTTSDVVLKEIGRVTDGKIGEGFDSARFAVEKLEADRRLQLRIPPGFADRPAKADASGDYLLWAEMLDEAQRRHQDVVFVTRDSKPDWWETDSSGRIIGPRIELVKELRDRTGQRLFLMRPTTFLAQTSKFTGVTADTIAAVDEADSALSTAARAVWPTSTARGLIGALKFQDPLSVRLLKLVAVSGSTTVTEAASLLGVSTDEVADAVNVINGAGQAVSPQSATEDLISEGSEDGSATELTLLAQARRAIQLTFGHDDAVDPSQAIP